MALNAWHTTPGAQLMARASWHKTLGTTRGRQRLAHNSWHNSWHTNRGTQNLARDSWRMSSLQHAGRVIGAAPTGGCQCNWFCTVLVSSLSENGLGRNTEFGMRDCCSEKLSSA